MVRVPEGSLTNPQRDEVRGNKARLTPEYCLPPLCGCWDQASDFGPISVSNKRQALSLFGGVGQNRSNPMGTKDPIGGVSPPPPFYTLPPLSHPIFLAPCQNPEKRKANRSLIAPRLLAFTVGSFWGMETYNRSLSSEHPHPVSIVQDGDHGSVLKTLQKGQRLLILNLKDAYFHIPIHPSFRHDLGFCNEGVVWQF